MTRMAKAAPLTRLTERALERADHQHARAPSARMSFGEDGGEAGARRRHGSLTAAPAPRP